jgi:hypothetical protein
MAKRAPDKLTDDAAPGADLQILFGENFRAARLKAGLSQTDVVVLSGIKRSKRFLKSKPANTTSRSRRWISSPRPSIVTWHTYYA